MSSLTTSVKTIVSIALSGVYFGIPCVYSKFPPIIWDALCCNHDKYGMTTAIGLVFGAIGDILLDINGDICFLMGMLAFGIGHLFNIYAFCLSKPSRSYAAMTACVLYFGLMMYLIIPFVSIGLMVPVILYGIVLCAAAYFAAIRHLTGDDSCSPASKRLALIGSVVFLASDTLLAFEIFRETHSSFISKYAIMLTYYAAQLCIALSSFVDSNLVSEDDEDRRLIETGYEPPVIKE